MDTFPSVMIFIIAFISGSSSSKMYMEERCGKKISLDEIGLHWIRLKPSKRAYYSPNMDCVVTIETDTTKQLVIAFQSIEIEYEPRCDDDYLLLYDGNSTNAPLLHGLNRKVCGSKAPTGYYETTLNTLTVRFKTDSWSNENGFHIIITSYHEGKCTDGEYQCDNRKCIPHSLVCDGMNNCGDSSDECQLSVEAIWAVFGGVIIITVLCVCVAINSRRRKRRQKRKTSNIQMIPIDLETPGNRVDHSAVVYQHSYPSVESNRPDAGAYYISRENLQIPGMMENGQNISFDMIGRMYDKDCIECRHECHSVDTTETDDYVHQMVKTKIPYNDKKGRSYSMW